MNSLDLHLDGDNAWPDLELIRDQLIHLADTTIGLAVLPAGMSSGLPSIALRFDVPVGDTERTVIFETSWALLAGAARAIGARYGWPGGAPSDG